MTAAAVREGPWLSRNLIVLCAVSFAQDAASELLYPILPIFLTVTLGAPVAVVGAVEGLAEGAASVSRLLSGRLADRRAKRPLIAAGYGLAALGKVVVAVAFAWPVVLLGRVVDRLGKGIRGAPRDALLVVGVPLGARGRAFGLHRAMDTAGAVVGPLLGLAGYELLHHHLRPLLALAVVPAVISVTLVRLVREGPALPARAGRTVTAEPLPREYWRTLAVLVAFSLVNFPDALVLLRVAELSHSVVFVIVAYVAYNAVYAAASYPAGALADRLGPRRVIAVGLLCFAVTYGGLGLATSTAAVWPLLAVYGFFAAATDGVGKSWISSLAPAGAQGRAQGLYQGFIGGGVLVAGVWAGLAWHGDGRGPLLASGCVAVLLAAVVAAPRVLSREKVVA